MQGATLNSLRIAFFLDVYHDNQDAGGTKSRLFLREAITLAQIMGLTGNQPSYTFYLKARNKKEIIWLLFVTERYLASRTWPLVGTDLERGVAMLHNLPVVLKCNAHFPSPEGDDASHMFPAFLKLINLFWIFDQSGAFDIFQNSSSDGLNFNTTYSYQTSLEIVKTSSRCSYRLGVKKRYSKQQWLTGFSAHGPQPPKSGSQQK
jgi:hypothetical protein